VNSHNITIQNQLPVQSLCELPSNEQIISWVEAVLIDKQDAELTIRMTDESEIINLNLQYRNQNKPTNVLSFPADLPSELNLPLLGDVVICASVVEKESLQQGKSVISHWAHMVIHGTLHLLGYDHLDEVQANEMEAKEIEILAQFGYSNPYLEMDI